VNKKKAFLILVTFWLLILIGFVGYKEYTLRTGTIVVLQTIPVDPRDLFRGDYVKLRYKISSIDLTSLGQLDHKFKVGDATYVELEIKDKYAIVTNVFAQPIKDKLFLKGEVRSVAANNLTVEYGIESYFVPENQGKMIESQIGKDVCVRVAIDSFGNAVIKELLIDGKPPEF